MGTVAIAMISPASEEGAGSFSPQPQEEGADWHIQELILEFSFLLWWQKHSGILYAIVRSTVVLWIDKKELQ